MGPEGSPLIINLISENNGRKLLVDVARVLSDMVSQNVISANDITLDVIDKQLKQRVGSEPDLLIMMTPTLDLQGYPPWHIRVTELFYSPHNTGTSYLVFLKALRKFSQTKINLGR